MTNIMAWGIELPRILDPADFARAWCQEAGIEIVTIGTGSDNLTIWIRPQPGVNHWRRLSSVAMFRRVEFVVLSDDSVTEVPPPAPPWYASLKPGDQVRAAKAPTSLYRDLGMTFDRFVPIDTPMTVSADAVVGTWVQVFKGATFQLWGRGDDLKAG